MIRIWGNKVISRIQAIDAAARPRAAIVLPGKSTSAEAQNETIPGESQHKRRSGTQDIPDEGERASAVAYFYPNYAKYPSWTKIREPYMQDAIEWGRYHP
jgi:hypothetical protein